MTRKRKILFPKVREGEWLRLPTRALRAACCSCGLVHLFEFRVTGRQMFIRAFHDSVGTRIARRKMKAEADE